MADDRRVRQALIAGSVGHRSPSLDDEMLAELIGHCEDFGRPGSEADFGVALFTVRFLGGQVGVIRAIDRPLRFHALIIEAVDFLRFGGCDPFWVSEEFPPDWTASGELAEPIWNGFNPDRRSVESLQEVLRTGDSPLLLGVVQGIVDGAKVVLERPAPDPVLARNVWRLLPYSTRAERTLATYAFSHDLGCDLMIVPKVEQVPDGWLSEGFALDYPEGRYEKQLQVAIEAGDQGTVDRLFWRRSSAQTLRLALWIVAAASVVSVLMRVLFGPVR